MWVNIFWQHQYESLTIPLTMRVTNYIYESRTMYMCLYSPAVMLLGHVYIYIQGHIYRVTRIWVTIYVYTLVYAGSTHLGHMYLYRQSHIHRVTYIWVTNCVYAPVHTGSNTFGSRPLSLEGICIDRIYESQTMWYESIYSGSNNTSLWQYHWQCESQSIYMSHDLQVCISHRPCMWVCLLWKSFESRPCLSLSLSLALFLSLLTLFQRHEVSKSHMSAEDSASEPSLQRPAIWLCSTLLPVCMCVCVCVWYKYKPKI